MPEARDRMAEEPAHDILAAEAFAVPAPDPVLSHHEPVRLPEDPSGIPDAHDVLAAEEFAMPAPAPGREAGSPFGASARTSRRGGILAALGLLAAVAWRRRRGG